ncbi:MAG: TRAP transporter substrate-binding protein DctP [Proteobacteria bacterium]|nr:TRAP transporter substrate-binding protein DctP [Pseudomonadota bacterium]
MAYFDLFHNPVNKAKNGVTLNYKGGPEVIPNRKQGAALKRGIVDLMFGPGSYYGGLVPCVRVITLSTTPQAKIRTNGAWDILQDCWKKGLNARILAHPFEKSSLFHVYLLDKPRLSEETGLDLKGYTMRTTSIYTPFLKKMGARPVNISPGDVYTSLQRGLVKGLAWPEGGVYSYGWSEFIKYRVGPGFWRSSTMALINLDAYNKLSKKERDVIDAAGLDFEQKSGPHMRKLADIDNAKIFKAGVKPIDLTGKAGAAFTRTVYDSTWASAKEVLPADLYANLRRLLLQ